MDFDYFKLENLIKKKGLQKKLIAHNCGFAVSLWSKWKYGSRTPTPQHLRDIAVCIGESTESFSDIKDNTNLENLSYEKLTQESSSAQKEIENFQKSFSKRFEEINNIRKALYTLTSSVDFALATKNSKGEYIYVNKAFVDMAGAESIKSIIGKTSDQLLCWSGSDRETNKVLDEKVRNSGKAIKKHKIYTPGSRKKKISYVSNFPMLSAEGKLEAILTIFEDATQYEGQQKKIDAFGKLEKTFVWNGEYDEDGSFKCNYCSDGSLSVIGISGEEFKRRFNVLESNSFTNIDIVDRKVLAAIKNMTLSIDEPWERTYEIRHFGTKENKWVTDCRYKVWDKDLKKDLVYGVINDVTETKAYELKLAELNKTLNSYIELLRKSEAIGTTISLLDKNGIHEIYMVSDYICKIINTTEEYYSKHHEMRYDYLVPGDYERLVKLRNDVLPKVNKYGSSSYKFSYGMHCPFFSAEGERIDYSTYTEPPTKYFDEYGHITKIKGGYQIITQVIDITSERSNRESFERFKYAIDSIQSVGFYIKKQEPPGVHYKNSGYEMVSDGVETITGHSFETFAADKTSFVKCIHPEDQKAYFDATRKNYADRTPYELKLRVRKDNESEYHWISYEVYWYVDSTGQPYYLGFIKDIENFVSLNNYNNALRTSIDRIGVAYSLTCLTTGKMVFANQAKINLFGFRTLEEMMEWDFYDFAKRFIHPEDQHIFEYNLEQRVQYAKPYRIIDMQGNEKTILRYRNFKVV